MSMANEHELLSLCSTSVEVVATINHLLHSNQNGFGFFTSSVYDSAWVSMVRRDDHNQNSWLFPETFEFIVRSQKEDGTWESYASEVDGILNTLASLLSLIIHDKSSRAEHRHHYDLASRIKRARAGLQSLLNNWSVDNTVHVGFEVLVPSLLSQLEDHGISFSFPGQRRLYELYNAKLKLFKPEALYSKMPTTLLHSLEALVGLIDFSKVSHHCNERLGIFGSPAATAAYLINTSFSDDKARKYLSTVVGRSGSGSVPSAFPTEVFESSWALSTLLPQLITSEGLDEKVAGSLRPYFQDLIATQQGVVGFAPGILGDADDTARLLLTLHHLGIDADPGPLIKRFASSGCFRTYELELGPSFSANCNVLLALLCCKDVDSRLKEIQVIVDYLLTCWTQCQLSDKWNLSTSYPQMLLADALVSLLSRVNSGSLSRLPKETLNIDIPVSLCQMLSKTLAFQQEDGSWSHSSEVTSYNMLIIAKCLVLPWSPGLRDAMLAAYHRAVKFVSATSGIGDKPEYLWVEKVTYGSALLRKVYRLAALREPPNEERWSNSIRSSFRALQSYSAQIHPFLSHLPLFTERSLQYVELALVEASRLVERLQTKRTLIFPRDESQMTTDKYLTFIPVIWTLCNQLQAQALSPSCVWEMIQLSMLNYQIDEYMETTVDNMPDSKLGLLLRHIRTTCGLDDISEEIFRSSAELRAWLGEQYDASGQDLAEFSRSKVARVIAHYASHVQNHPSVVRLDAQDRRALAVLLHDFQISHIAQNLNSRALVRSRRPSVRTPTSELSTPEKGFPGFFDWVRSGGRDSTSCMLSFDFFAALLGDQAEVLFTDARARYLSSALASHLATLCRMYNDYGSAARDADEGTLNSLDFAGFSSKQHDNGSEPGNQSAVVENNKTTAKEALLSLANFERQCLESAFGELEKTVRDSSVMAAIRVFVNVTDLFGQIYVQRDIASRKMAAPKAKL